jgi:hypothetical protein
VSVRPARPPRALAAPALALVLPLAACAGTDAADADAAAAATAETGQRIEVRVTGGQVTGDTGRVPVPVGDQVTLVLTSDVADEVHVHGYDLTADLAPGTPAELAFAATVPGVFEVELHDAGTVLVSLQVS